MQAIESPWNEPEAASPADELAYAVGDLERAEGRRRAMEKYGRVPQAVCDSVLDSVEAAEARLRGLIRAVSGGRARAVLEAGKVVIDLADLGSDEALPGLLVLDTTGIARV